MKVYKTSATCLIPEIVGRLTVGNPLEKRIVFCEDKFTLALELAIAKASGGTFATNVYSFNRFMHKKLKVDRKVLSPEGCALVVKGLLLENKKELSCFKNVYDPNLASTVYELIAQLKSAKVTPEDIKNAYENSDGNLKRKLKDIYLLFSAYEEYIAKNSLTDGNNRLSLLPEFFKNDEEIKNTKVIIAGFPSLNRTLCEIFKAIVDNAKSVDFVVVAGENAGVYTNETYNFAVNNFECEIELSKTLPIRNNLLSGLFNPETYDKVGEFSPNVFLYCAEDLQSEIEHVAQLIKSRVIEKGAKYKDFTVCAENIEEYRLIIARVFADYDIPFFLDLNKNLGKHPITRLICSYLDVVRRNFDLSDIFSLVKNPLFIIDKSLSDGFENYCIRSSINRKKIKQPFTVADERLEEYENIRLTLLEIADYLPKKATVSQMISGINKMIERINAFENLSKISDSLSTVNREDLTAYNDQADQKYLSVVGDIINLLGDKELSLIELKNLILSGMTACKVGIIPEYNDCVFVGDFRSVRYNESPILFAVGLTDSVPLTKIDSALLCDRDIDKMERARVLVEPKIKEVNRRAKECACMALASFSEQLYLSYPQKTLAGEEGKPSQIFGYAQAIFSDQNKKTVIYSDKDYADLAKKVGGERLKNYRLRSYLTDRSSTFAFAKEIGAYKEGLIDDFSPAGAYYKTVKNSEQEKTVNGILSLINSEVGFYSTGVDYVGEGLSATAIEGYFNCPYANFLSRGVKLVEREESTIKSNDLGTMIHLVGETFAKKVDFNKDEEYIKKFASEIFDEVASKDAYKRYQNSESGKRKFEFIKEEALKFCLGLYHSSKHSKLKPKHLEIYFGGKYYPAISVNTKHGEKKVTGKVDRIDTDGENMAIIDYKTGQIHNKEINLYTGQNLQLYLYAKAFSDKYKPIGVYYFPVSNKFEDEGKIDECVLVGKTLFDKDMAKLIDDNLENQDKSVYTNANLALTAKGEIKSPNAMLTKKEFESYMKYSQEIAGKGLEEITDGVIIPSPYQGSCEYCKYHGICGYNEQIDCRTREIFDIKKIDILRATGDAKQEDEDANGGEK
ncbi:MAG: PD-(D/E)XK nuclease family protein [Clostridia bacterium]|nr:PD-(D/E)XK nuclease family protein [Clostridia bacterium]